MSSAVQISAISGVPDIKPGDKLDKILGECLEKSGGVREHDILCIAHKVVSKAEGNLIKLSDVRPSKEANRYALELNKSPEKVEVILSQSKRVVRAFKHPRQNEGTMICEHKLGFISANAAVDESNSDFGTLITLPDAPDLSAKRLGESLEKRFGVTLGIVITDTFGRPWRLGQVNVAIGLYKVPTRISEIGTKDGWGRELFVTEPAFSDEIAAASGLVITKAAKTPLVLVRGANWTPLHSTKTQDILRDNAEDMFR